jgi:hypothetical protein
MLRLSGVAPLFSKLRAPRLPKLEPPPENELPARASAKLGAKARAKQKNSDSKMRHWRLRPDRGFAANRLDMIMSVREPNRALVQYGGSALAAKDRSARHKLRPIDFRAGAAVCDS